jgi:hypothetical protein
MVPSNLFAVRSGCHIQFVLGNGLPSLLRHRISRPIPASYLVAGSWRHEPGAFLRSTERSGGRAARSVPSQNETANLKASPS